MGLVNMHSVTLSNTLLCSTHVNFVFSTQSEMVFAAHYLHTSYGTLYNYYYIISYNIFLYHTITTYLLVYSCFTQNNTLQYYLPRTNTALVLFHLNLTLHATGANCASALHVNYYWLENLSYSFLL